MSSATAIRVSLGSTLRLQEASDAPAALPLLNRAGPLACLGATAGEHGLSAPVQPSASALFGPRGACLLGDEGPLWVCDTGHHRLLGWAARPTHDLQAADWVMGQPTFDREGRNAKGEVSASTLNVPTGIAACGDAGLAVADAWNHRVLIWWRAPRDAQVPADIVLGQSDFASAGSNRGAAAPTAATLFWPYGVHWDGARLWVADSGNRRVLMWQGLPSCNGQPADLVLGQRDFACRDENGGGDPGPASLRWPHAVAIWRGRLCVADAGNNRVMVWDGIPADNGAPCDWVLGQSGFAKVDNNQSLYWPNAASLNMPYGMAAVGDWLLVADTANSRLLGWHVDDCRTGAPARTLAAQPDFRAKGDNRWQLPARDSVCWPYGVAVCGDTAVIADSGNNRVLLWRLAAGLAS
ncbi:MAG: hypothetical protein V4792_05585 [Pseudomonadota bacterium]